MAAWTALTFSALEVLAAAKMNQMVANFTALVQNASGIPDWTEVVIKPGSSVFALTIDQDYNTVSFDLDSEGTTTPVFRVRPANTAGTVALFINETNQTSGELVQINQYHASTAAGCLRLNNSGVGNDVVANNFSLKNGYIAPGGDEALRWDVVIFDLDGTSPDSQTGYTVDTTKVRVLTSCVRDVSAGLVSGLRDYSGNYWNDCTVDDDAGGTVEIAYGSGFVEHDFGYVFIGTIA